MIKLILGLFAAVPTYFVFKILTSLGIAFVSYIGYELVFSSAIAALQSNASGMSSDLLVIMNMLGLPEAIGLLFSAVQTGFIMKSINRVFVGKAIAP